MTKNNSPKLVIVESPAKEKTVGKYLGKDFKVKASVGHIRDLPKKNEQAVDMNNDFKPSYVITPGKEKVVEEIKKLSRQAPEVYLATDPDREGEAIAWHITEAAEIPENKTRRIVFHEITESALKEALKKPREIDRKLKEAQEARRVLDRIFGYELSGLIWKKLRYGLSAGRVQSPALRILAEREREIQDFVPVSYQTITAELKTEPGEIFTANCSEEPTEQQRTEDIISAARKGTWQVRKVKEQEVKRRPQPPFITSTLQRTASSRLGFSPSKTMQVAQRLYEAGHITYMRTDSTALAQDALKQLHQVITKEFGSDYLESHQYKTNSRLAQEAHEAIRPSNLTKTTAGANNDQKKLYELIRKRTIASQMKPAVLKRTTILTNITDNSLPDFKTVGSRIIFDGWFQVDPAARGEETELPAVENEQQLQLQTITPEDKETQPPPRYSEAGLVKELEKRGIGRPSTYASIIRTIQDRGYVEKQGRALCPTDTGMVVSDFLENHFAEYIADNFTAEMENELDEIAAGTRNYAQTLKEFYQPFSETIANKQSMDKITNLEPADKKFRCPKCGKDMVVKLSKSGKFISCSSFPECTGARTIEGEEIPEPQETGEECPECSKGKLIERHGRYGKFVGCDRYPKCKYIKQSEEERAKASTGVSCPQCQKGEMMAKRGRYGEFYACSNYPACRYTINAKPTGDLCPDCGSLMMEGTKTIPNRCSNKKCPNHRPDKKQK